MAVEGIVKKIYLYNRLDNCIVVCIILVRDCDIAVIIVDFDVGASKKHLAVVNYYKLKKIQKGILKI